MSTPCARLSVLIPARNAQDTLGATLNSLSGARECIGEIIVVDDGSTDRTAEVARAAAARLSLPLRVVAGPAQGVSAARNVALDEARCPWIYLLDADDLVLPEGLLALTRRAAAPGGHDLVVGVAIDRRGEQRSRHAPTPFKPSALTNAEDYITYTRPLFRMGSVLARRGLLTKFRFPPNMPVWEDGIFWTRVLTAAQPLAADIPILEYVIDNDRATLRLTENHRAKLLTLIRAIKGLRDVGISREAMRRSVGRNALTVSRHLIATGASLHARRMLRIAWAMRLPLIDRLRIAKAWLKLTRS